MLGRRPKSESPPTWTDGRGREWLQVDTAAKRLKTSKVFIYSLGRAKRIRRTRHDGLIYVSAADLSAYQERQRALRRLLKQKQYIGNGATATA